MKDFKSRKRLFTVLFFCISLHSSSSAEAFVTSSRTDLSIARVIQQLPSSETTFSRREILFKNKRRSFCRGQVASLPTADDGLPSLPPWPSPHQTTSANANQKKKSNDYAKKGPSYAGAKYRYNSGQSPRSQSSSSSSRNNHNPFSSQSKALNTQLVACESAKEVLDVSTSSKLMMTQCAGGGTMNSVNFSTSLHRIARHIVSNPNTRVQVLSDPRFALLLCATAEAMAGLDYTLPLSLTVVASTASTADATNNDAKNRIFFQSRDMSNIAWALAKLRFVPPQTTYPMARPPSDTAGDAALLQSALPVYEQTLVETSLQVRLQLLEAARRRRKVTNEQQQQQQQQHDNKDDNNRSDKPLWIATLSQLAAIILDTISCRILVQDNAVFQSQEWANSLWAMATTQRADPLVFDAIALRFMEGIKQQQQQQQQNQSPATAARPQEFSNSIWAFATAQVTGSPQEQLLIFMADLMERRDFVEAFKPQELSNTVWGVATILAYKKNQQLQAATKSTPLQPEEEQAALRILRHVARSVIARADQFKSQELSNSAWAMARLGFGQWSESESNYNDLNDYTVLASDQVEQDEKLLVQALESLAKSAMPRLSSFRSQELNNLAWSLARLLGNSNSCEELQPKRFFKLLEGIGRELCDLRRKATSQDVSTTLWSLANLGFFQKEVYSGIAARVDFHRGRDFKPQELCNVLHALANNPELTPQFVDIFDTTFAPLAARKAMMARADSQTVCFATGANELMKRPQDFKPQEIKDVLWSFSKAGFRHPTLFRSVAEYLVGPNHNAPNREAQHTGKGLDEFGPQGLGNLVWSYAKQAQFAQGASKRFAGGSAMQGRLAVYTASYFDVGEVLIKRFVAAIAETNLRMHDQLSKLSPQDLSNSCWAFAVLGLRHDQFLEAARAQLVDRLNRVVLCQGDPFTTRFKGQELANIVWAFATLNCQFVDLPDVVAPYMMHLCKNEQGTVDTKSIARAFNRLELGNIAWSCAVIGRYPNDLLKIVYDGLVGGPNESNPVYLRQIFNDRGLEKPVIMSLLYLQMALDLDNNQTSWVLPDNFPDSWYATSSSDGGLDDEGDDGMDTVSEFELNLSISKTQRAVSSALSRIGFQHVQEHAISMKEMVDEGVQFAPLSTKLLSIDIADVTRKVGIEVDGPVHFLSVIDTISEQEGEAVLVNDKLEYSFRWDYGQQQINGPTVLKQRLLSALGWKVIHLPFWEWQAINGDAQKEEEYCRNLVSRI